MTLAAMKEAAAFETEPPVLLGNPKLAALAFAGTDLAPVWNALVRTRDLQSARCGRVF